jgi:hypothetical protein
MLKAVEKQDAREAREELLPLDAIAREGARRMLSEALKAEADAYVERHRGERDAYGRALVVRNGRAHERKLTLGTGTVELKAPRVDDRRRDEPGGRQRFTSHILPRYLRRSPKVAEVLPLLYLRGLSTGDFRPALEGCWARTRPVCRRPTSPGLPPVGRKNIRPFANARWSGASTFTCGSTGCISTFGSRTTGSAPW